MELYKGKKTDVYHKMCLHHFPMSVYLSSMEKKKTAAREFLLFLTLFCQGEKLLNLRNTENIIQIFFERC